MLLMTGLEALWRIEIEMGGKYSLVMAITHTHTPHTSDV